MIGRQGDRAQEREGATFVFSTHDPQLISHAEEAFVLQDGALIEHRIGEATS